MKPIKIILPRPVTPKDEDLLQGIKVEIGNFEGRVGMLFGLVVEVEETPSVEDLPSMENPLNDEHVGPERNIPDGVPVTHPYPVHAYD